ncbi:unnamed protein product [Heligmosomoides polygyrus]|uniref:EB domain-containing protein n=1 Tax=Heligmosomoides polygyrus TaxID=6339 RepID=A0A3P8FYB8_HELPZ|nr:unnamed protein product [Heligmosomoides polygyrus]
MCPNYRPPAMLNGFIRSCPIEGQTGGCPNGNTCQRATNDLLVCCPSSISRHSGKQNSLSICPDNRCDVVNECSHGFLCSASDVRDVQVCCSSGATPAGDFSASPSKTNIANINEEEWVVIEG